MGCTEICPGQFSPSHLTCSAISRGPVAQLRPITGTSSAWTIVAAAAMSAPTSKVPGGLDRDLDEDRHVLAGLVAGALGAVDRGLDLQRVLAGLDQRSHRPPPAISPAHCSASASSSVLVGDMAERGQPGARPDRAEHKAGAAVMGEFGDRLARQLGGAPVQLEGAVGDAELAERDRRAAKAVGLHRVAAGFEIAAVDLADQVGAAVAQDLGAVLVAEKVALDVEVARLHLGPHRAVAQQHPVGEVVERWMRHRDHVHRAAKPLSAALRGRGRGPRRRRGRVRWAPGSIEPARPALTLPSPAASGGRGRITRKRLAHHDHRRGGFGGAHAEQVADRDDQVGAVQRVEMEFVDAVGVQPAALLGGERGGDEPARVGIVVEPVEMRRPSRPGSRRRRPRCHSLQLGEIGDRQDAGHDRHRRCRRPRARSRKRRNTSTSKKNWVIARVAPASSLASDCRGRGRRCAPRDGFRDRRRR